MAEEEVPPTQTHIDPTDGLTKRNDQGLYECEVWEGTPEVDAWGDLTGAEGSKEWKTCEKNPGHKHFISAQDFGLEHLPEEYRTQEVLALVQAEADLTVRLRVRHTSANRPDGFPFSKFRGQDTTHTGTGVITCVCVDEEDHTFDSDDDDSEEEGYYFVEEGDERDEETRRRDFEAYEKENKRPAFTIDNCPCPDCEDVRFYQMKEKDTKDIKTAQSYEAEQTEKPTDGDTNNHGACQDDQPTTGAESKSAVAEEQEVRPCWMVLIETALHVVYDTKEARNTVVDVFHNSNSSSPSSRCLYGFCVIKTYEEEDRCIFECATHNEELVHLLSACVTRRYQLNKALGRPVAPQAGDSVSRPTEHSGKATSSFANANEGNTSPSPETYHMAIVIGHPHGRSKTISVGRWTQRIKTGKAKFSVLTQYIYDAATCKGNSGGAVMTFGKVEDERLTTVLLNHRHMSSCSTPGLSISSPSFEITREAFGET